MATETMTAAGSGPRTAVIDNGTRRDWLWAALFLAPMAIGLAVFYLWPVLATFYYSFTRMGVFGGATWVGLDNYIKVLTSPKVQRALVNTLLYTAVIICSIPISLVIAVLLERRGLKFVGLFRLMFFLPVITLPVAIGWLWKILLNGNYGVVNAILNDFGLPGYPWLAQSSTALAAVSIVGVWASIGYPVVLFVAALKGVPRDLHEAAEIDGAGPVRRFFSITIPVISPTIFFVTVLTIIGALQMFDLVYVMIGSQNPAIADTETVIYLFYRTAFIDNDKGLASAIVFSLMIVVMLLTAFQFRLQRRWVHYG
jgi:multiple sugar transport system permease protein